MTRLYYGFSTTSHSEEVYFGVRACYEFILLILSTWRFRQHATGNAISVKKMTDIVAFHIAHMTFCVLATAKESWTVFILTRYKESNCYFEGISSITAAPQHVALAASLALFFNHW